MYYNLSYFVSCTLYYRNRMICCLSDQSHLFQQRQVFSEHLPSTYVDSIARIVVVDDSVFVAGEEAPGRLLAGECLLEERSAVDNVL